MSFVNYAFAPIMIGLQILILIGIIKMNYIKFQRIVWIIFTNICIIVCILFGITTCSIYLTQSKFGNNDEYRCISRFFTYSQRAAFVFVFGLYLTRLKWQNGTNWVITMFIAVDVINIVCFVLYIRIVTCTFISAYVYKLVLCLFVTWCHIFLNSVGVLWYGLIVDMV